jgi:penicillin-binding protein 1A
MGFGHQGHLRAGSASHAGGAPRSATTAARLFRTMRWIAIAAGTIAGVFATLMIATTVAIPNPMTHGRQLRAPMVRVFGAQGEILAERGVAYDYTPIDLLPRHVLDALVATEDRRYFDHWGLDPVGLFRAMFANLRAGRYVQGGSTITQQLAKNLFLSSERRLGRKFQELFLAVWLELRLSKADILELYLNRVYFGGGAYGIEAAAQRYFDKSARDLSVMEAAVIAGVLKAPSKYSPLTNPPLARSRARIVIENMRVAGFLSDEQAHAAATDVVGFRNLAREPEATGLEYAIDYVLERLPPLATTSADELDIETTIDGKLQRAAQQRLTQMLDVEGHASGADQGALIIMTPDGAIRAMAGGRNFAESQFNRATRAKRQPGSAFKPFVYLSALESGMTPATIVYDLPLSIKGWSPRNDNGTYKGAMTLRQALAQSVNTVAVRLHLDLGVKRTAEVAQRLGIRSELREEPSLALGTSEVTLTELTGAYAAFANGGFRAEPHIIERVHTGAGVLLYSRALHVPVRVIDERPLAEMNDMLQATLIDGTGHRAALAHRAAAGKTGTSQEFRDAWFIGYTSELAGGVWIGNDNGHPMNKIMGGTLPARLWHDVMSIAHDGLPALPLAMMREANSAAALQLPSTSIDEALFARAAGH